MLTKATSAKKIKFLPSYIRNHGIPESIRTDYGSGFNSDVVKEFCKSLHPGQGLQPGQG